ncbi:hypothetical protein C7T94_16265 [Pedobacter yulinensis]|uniref:Uncharacterized protein n=1 Tax=Pedobacter yulinensis TaxID=2126353 RepID=A0A2T3HIR4_9SPHI|nr:histidine kinase [Pedobacter yulinensis]PST82334.1 hypothetical protein C7T94_16265 [Pedobacter yulinensis]
MKKTQLLRMVLIGLALAVYTAPLAARQPRSKIDSLRGALAGAKQDTGLVKTMYHLADTYRFFDTDSSWYFTRQGSRLAERLRWAKGIAAFHTNKGNLMSYDGRDLESISHYDSAYTIYKQLGHTRNVAASLNNIGAAYQHVSDNVRALRYTLLAIAEAEKTTDRSLISLCYNNVVSLFFAQQNYDRAIFYCRKALAIARKSEDLLQTADVLDMMGNVLVAQGHPAAGEAHYRAALGLARRTGDSFAEATVLSHYALLFERDKQRKIALLLHAQTLFESSNPKRLEAITNLGNIGGTYAAMALHDSIGGRPVQLNAATKAALLSKAAYFLTKTMAMSRLVKDPDNLAYFADNLAQVQEATGRYREALINMKLAVRLNDSIYSQENKNKLARLESLRELRLRDKQIELNKFKIRQMWLYGAIIGVLLVSGFLIIVYRFRIRQLRLTHRLRQKEAEAKERELLHRSRLSESELKAIRAQMNPHFIFNVLNSIESYVLDNDARTASRLIQKFAALSRLILENSTQSLVPAEREWKVLKLYAELESIRFDHRFGYSFRVDPEIDLAGLMLPPMLVQPLIENSIHHGLQAGNGTQIDIVLKQTDNGIRFVVEDDGVGMQASKPAALGDTVKGKSIGLSAIRERVSMLNNLYRDARASFNIGTREKGVPGTIATIDLPARYELAVH